MIVIGSYSSIQEVSAQILEKKNNLMTEVLLTVHLLKVGDLVEIAHIDDSKVLNSIGDAYRYLRLVSVA